LGGKPEDHMEDLGVEGEILDWLLGKYIVGWESVDWIHLAQDRDQWRDLVNVVMKIPVP
jgi:hypothetical protein